MRRFSFLVLLGCFLLSGLSGLSGVVTNAQQTDPPAAQAKKITRVRQGGNITAKMLIHKVQPKYPGDDARDKAASGTVRLHAIIANDGSVSQLEVISGDPLLVSASIEAVRQWKYRVTYLNGEPVEVDTTIDIIFKLNR